MSRTSSGFGATIEDRLVAIARRFVPRDLRYAIQRHVSLTNLKRRVRERAAAHADVQSSDSNTAGSPYRFGIVCNPSFYHDHYLAACLEMGVPFRVIDLLGVDWLDAVRASGCDVLLAWPDATLTVWANVLKDRIEVVERELRLPVFPGSREIWPYENKPRMAYWLAAHGVPHPRTWVFTDREACLGFASTCELPMVFKTPFGASASGVKILRNRGELQRTVRRAFARGIVPNGLDRRDRQWGIVLLQEYISDAREWRLVRIGDSFFGHPKGRIGEFHSGSGVVLWDVPEPRHLDFLEQVTDAGGFRSMNVDVFETPDGRLLVNELQAVFGAGFSVDQLRVDGRPGRFVRRGGTGEWVFEPGEFARNTCANERVRFVIESRLAGTGSLAASRGVGTP